MEWTAEQLAVAEELTQLLTGVGVDAAYDAVAGTQHGRILNADLARALCPHYQTLEDRLRFTAATYPPCAGYVRRRYSKALASLEKRNPQIVFLAGGAASGKTTAVGSRIDFADVVFDSNLAGFEKANRMIDEAVDVGWLVTVVYVHRSFRAAVESMLERAIIEGRYIPLRSSDGQDMASLHFNAQRTFVRLVTCYADNTNVGFIAIRNGWTPQQPADPHEIPIQSLALGGKRHYTAKDDLYAAQKEVVDHVQSQGRLSARLLGAIGLDPP